MPCLDGINASTAPARDSNAVAIDAGRITADNERAVRLDLLPPRLRYQLGAKEAVKAGTQEGLIGVDGVFNLEPLTQFLPLGSTPVYLLGVEVVQFGELFFLVVHLEVVPNRAAIFGLDAPRQEDRLEIALPRPPAAIACKMD